MCRLWVCVRVSVRLNRFGVWYWVWGWVLTSFRTCVAFNFPIAFVCIPTRSSYNVRVKVWVRVRVRVRVRVTVRDRVMVRVSVRVRAWVWVWVWGRTSFSLCVALNLLISSLCLPIR
jgi:hypothetical protein